MPREIDAAVKARAVLLMIGTDWRKRTHTVVSLDEVRRRLGTRTVSINADGHLALLT